MVVSQVRCGHQVTETYLATDCRAKCGVARIDMKSNFMNTAFLLMAQYGGKAIVPIEDVCRDYFSHLNPTKLIQKISAGDIAIPLVRTESSQKCAKGVDLLDLAKYLDARVDAARKEMPALTT
jgi:Pyocin activator protein PrtN